MCWTSWTLATASAAMRGKEPVGSAVVLIKGSAALGQHPDDPYGESSSGWAEGHWYRTAGCQGSILRYRRENDEKLLFWAPRRRGSDPTFGLLPGSSDIPRQPAPTRVTGNSEADPGLGCAHHWVGSPGGSSRGPQDRGLICRPVATVQQSRFQRAAKSQSEREWLRLAVMQCLSAGLNDDHAWLRPRGQSQDSGFIVKQPEPAVSKRIHLIFLSTLGLLPSLSPCPRAPFLHQNDADYKFRTCQIINKQIKETVKSAGSGQQGVVQDITGLRITGRPKCHVAYCHITLPPFHLAQTARTAQRGPRPRQPGKLLPTPQAQRPLDTSPQSPLPASECPSPPTVSPRQPAQA